MDHAQRGLSAIALTRGFEAVDDQRVTRMMDFASMMGGLNVLGWHVTSYTREKGDELIDCWSVYITVVPWFVSSETFTWLSKSII